jgi:hypothetical protein
MPGKGNGMDVQRFPANVCELSKQLEKMSQCARSPRPIQVEEQRFKTFPTGGGHLGPGQYKTYRQYVLSPAEEYNPEKVAAKGQPKYSQPKTGKDSPGGMMSFLGGSASMPSMGPGKYPAEEYQKTGGGAKAYCLSSSAKPAAWSFPNETKFFTLSVGSYRKNLGPGSYSLPDGFKPTQEAERQRQRALRSLKHTGEHWAASEFSKMYMRDARRGPGYTKEYAPTPEQLKAIDAMLGKK